MAIKKSWIPKQEVKLTELMEIWQEKLGEPTLQTDYGWPEEECTTTKATLAAFPAARTVYQNAPTKGNRVEKDERKDAGVEAMRKFARERIRNNGKMTDAQKLEMGVTVQDMEPSPVPTPEEGPESEAVINAREPGVVKVRYLGSKPYGVDRIEIAWSVSDTAIDSADQLTNHETFSHNPWERTFAAADRGKKMYYSLRYLTREDMSHWSGTGEVIIP